MFTHNIPFSIYKRKSPKIILIESAAMGFFSKGLKNEFETVVLNEPSVFYCTILNTPNGISAAHCPAKSTLSCLFIFMKKGELDHTIST